MAEKHGLGRLEVGIAGHNDLDVSFCLLDDGPLQVDECLPQRGNLIQHVEAHIGGCLVVAAAARVELASHLANQFT